MYVSSNLQLPGVLFLGHETVNYESGGAKNDYNMIKVNYKFPEFQNQNLIYKCY